MKHNFGHLKPNACVSGIRHERVKPSVLAGKTEPLSFMLQNPQKAYELPAPLEWEWKW